MNGIKDLIIIGGGPAGYVAAIRASQLGLKVRLIERDDLGGICLNWGCIPTKTLLHASDTLALLRSASDLGIVISADAHIDLPRMIQRSRDVAKNLRLGVQHLLKKHCVEVIRGNARLDGPGKVIVDSRGEKSHTFEAQTILIATGASPRNLADLAVDGDRIWNYRHALTPTAIPASLLVVGAGAIGMEFASFYAALGAQVTVVETLARVLPNEDEEVSQWLSKAFTARGINIRTNTSATLKALTANAAVISLQNGDQSENGSFDRVLVCAGVVGNSEGLGLETTQVITNNGCIRVDENGCTDEPGIYAAGDICGAPMLAHKASHEGIRCIEHLAGLTDTHGAPLIPACTYCDPQVASVGVTEAQARASGRNISVGRFPFQGNGKALAIGKPHGFIKTIFDTHSGELLGAHLVGPDVTELINQLSLAQRLEATEEVLMTHIFAHPTLSEAIGESALSAFNRAIHI